jgi:hypothetical protein
MNEHKYTQWHELLGYLITNPQYWNAYVSKCAFTSKTPFDMKMPWLSMPAIDFLEENLKKNMEVIEFGGGGSTFYFAKKTKSVTTIESNEGWIEKLQNAINDTDITNVKLEFKPFLVDTPKKLKESPYIATLSDKKYDVILIDGPEINDYQARPVCFEWAEKHIKLGGYIVVDDAWRYAQLHGKNHAKKSLKLKGIGPGRKGLTQTDIYFY